jgi:DMSO reductase family type II enzyme heme b subunit
MLIAKKSNAPDLGDPGASAWQGASSEKVKLAPTPIGLQPTPYIQTRWGEEKSYGQIGNVDVRALSDGKQIFIRLSWSDATEDRDPRGNESFADGAALGFPVKDDAPLITMGSPDQPVNAWLWRANLESESAPNLIATGLGTSIKTAASTVRCKGIWKEGRWAVVFSRALTAPEAAGGGAQFASGEPIKFGVAVWNGSNSERAGIKAYSEVWKSLKLEG